MTDSEFAIVVSMIVYKLDENGRCVWQYPAEVLEQGQNYVRLEAFFNRDDKDFGWAVFKRDDRFVEYFYNDRWYNIFAVYDRDDGELKGWYCNICRPANITATAVACEDLALDLWVDPDGTPTILDEDEFDALDVSDSDKGNGRCALNQLLHLAQTHTLPC